MKSLVRTTLIAVRHGETEWNASGRAQGHLNSPLTANGRRQAELLAKGLIGRGIEVIVSSDLGRAVETCEPIAKTLGLPFRTDPGLRERHLGHYQGLTRKEFAEKHPQAFATYTGDCPETPIPGGGESRMQHLQRCVALVSQQMAQEPDKTVLFVCHGGVLDCFFYHSLSMKPRPKRPFSILNASINTFEVTSQAWKLITWGDVAHLKLLSALDET